MRPSLSQPWTPAYTLHPHTLVGWLKGMNRWTVQPDNTTGKTQRICLCSTYSRGSVAWASPLKVNTVTIRYAFLFCKAWSLVTGIFLTYWTRVLLQGTLGSRVQRCWDHMSVTTDHRTGHQNLLELHLVLTDGTYMPSLRETCPWITFCSQRQNLSMKKVCR